MFDRKLNKNTQLPEYGIADITGLQEALGNIPTIVQTTGISTTDAMSQDATTNMLFQPLNDAIQGKVRVNTARNSASNIAIGQDSTGVTLGNGAVLLSPYYTQNNPQTVGEDAILIGAWGNSMGAGAANNRPIASPATVSIGSGTGANRNRGGIVIGGHANNSPAAEDNYIRAGVAIGYEASNLYNGSIALGSKSTTTRPYELSLGTAGASSTSSVPSRFIANVTDPELPQDAATKAYVDANAGGVTPVQTTGDSTTDVMSQKATTDMVFAPGDHNYIRISSPAGTPPNASEGSIVIGGNNDGIVPSIDYIKIGRGTINARGTSSVSIGNGALVNDHSTVAIGSSAKAYNQASIAIGVNSSANNNFSVALGMATSTTRNYEVSVGNTGSAVSSTRYIANLKDPELPQDAATKAYVDGGLDAKLDKVTTGSGERVYGITSGNEQETIAVSMNGAAAGTIPKRTAGGQVVTNNGTADNHAATIAQLHMAMGTVVHGSTATTDRPTGYAVVTWIGDVEPTNATVNDIWINTTP